jgi:hypothetical protein
MRLDGEPTKWVDEWSLPLSALDRTKIKSVLLKAHATFHRGNWQDYEERAIPAMQQAMSGIAGILYDAGFLTLELLEDGLQLFVVEAAAAGNWATFRTANDAERTEIFPGHFGSETRWTVFKQRWPLALAAEIADWHSKLLDRSVQLGLHSSAAVVERDRKALSEAYFAAFPTALILDVCWAAEQRYSEWKRWLRYDPKAKDGSKPDRAFRAILTSGKTPFEYRKQPRPNGWK